ncbi:hypothetical protein BH18ACI4_BH18ACI4_25440 [soil metagenome]
MLNEKWKLIRSLPLLGSVIDRSLPTKANTSTQQRRRLTLPYPSTNIDFFLSERPGLNWERTLNSREGYA